MDNQLHFLVFLRKRNGLATINDSGIHAGAKKSFLSNFAVAIKESKLKLLQKAKGPLIKYVSKIVNKIHIDFGTIYSFVEGVEKAEFVQVKAIVFELDRQLGKLVKIMQDMQNTSMQEFQKLRHYTTRVESLKSFSQGAKEYISRLGISRFRGVGRARPIAAVLSEQKVVRSVAPVAVKNLDELKHLGKWLRLLIRAVK
jgi:hypothetical protein